MTTTNQQGGAGRSVRRFVVYTLLFILVILAGIGLSGLLGRLLDGARLLADGDTTGLALNLAWALIAGPLAAVLWWTSWRSMAKHDERDSVLWGLYVAGMSTVALVVAVIGLLTSVTGAVSGEFDVYALANGVVWASIWTWHKWMTHHPAKSPTRLAGGSRVLGALIGIVIGSIGLVGGIAALLDEVVAGQGLVGSVGDPWWVPVVQGLMWAAAGALVWWRHWYRDGGRLVSTGFSTVVLVLIAGLGSTVLGLGGLAITLHTALVAIVDRSEPLSRTLEPLPGGIAAALVGTLVWVLYRREVASRGGATAIGTRLVTSGVGLAAAASGVGVIVNSLLGALATSLTETDELRLLLGGISALVVGAPVWWMVWKPLEPVSEQLARNAGRRVYLITVFGVSALVAIITLLVIAFELFQVGLDGSGDLINNIRASLGLLVATALVFVYHFAVWRRDRASVGEAAPVSTISRVVLVAGAGSDELARSIRDLTGASVQVHVRADGVGTVPSRDELTAALAEVGYPRVLVMVGDGAIEVVPLEG